MTSLIKHFISKPSLFFLFIFNIICTHSLHCFDGFGFGKPDYSNIFGNSRSFGITTQPRNTDFFSSSSASRNTFSTDNTASLFKSIASDNTPRSNNIMDYVRNGFETNINSNSVMPISHYIEKNLGISRHSNTTSYQHKLSKEDKQNTSIKTSCSIEDRKVQPKTRQEVKNINADKPVMFNVSSKAKTKFFEKDITAKPLQNLYTKQLNTNGVNLSKNITINQDNSAYHYHDDGNTFDNRFKQKSIFNHKKSEPWFIKFGRSRNTRQEYVSQHDDTTSYNHQKTINNQLDKSDKKEEESNYVISDLVHKLQQNKSRELEERYSIEELAILNNPDLYDYFDQRKIDKLSRGIKNLIDQQFDVESLKKLNIKNTVQPRKTSDIDYIKAFAESNSNFVVSVAAELALYSRFIEELDKDSIDAFGFLLSAIEIRREIMAVMQLANCLRAGGLSSFCLKKAI